MVFGKVMMMMIVNRAPTRFPAESLKRETGCINNARGSDYQITEKQFRCPAIFGLFHM